MAAKMKPVTDLEAYWRRERDFRRRLPLIDEVTFYSIDTPAPHYGRVCRTEQRRRRSAKWELKRINKAAAMLPKRLWNYRKVLFAIYYHSPLVDKVIAACGYSRRQYYNILALLLDFFTTKIRYFQRLND